VPALPGPGSEPASSQPPSPRSPTASRLPCGRQAHESETGMRKSPLIFMMVPQRPAARPPAITTRSPDQREPAMQRFRNRLPGHANDAGARRQPG